MAKKRALFPALLKYWRGASGLSQLDLALAADVSSRHVSFLETGRATPSEEMVLRLATALKVPLRDQNAMLSAAGFKESFEEPGIEDLPRGPVRQAIERMLAQHEPFPMVVMDRHYNVLRTNEGAAKMLGLVIKEPAALPMPINAFRILFDPNGVRPYILDWERCARGLLSHLHIESLQRPADEGLASLVRGLLEYPDVPQAWVQPDFSRPVEPAFSIRLKRDDLQLAFLTTVTAFNAPGNITLQELRIESYFPLDEETEHRCRQMAG